MCRWWSRGDLSLLWGHYHFEHFFTSTKNLDMGQTHSPFGYVRIRKPWSTYPSPIWIKAAKKMNESHLLNGKQSFRLLWGQFAFGTLMAKYVDLSLFILPAFKLRYILKADASFCLNTALCNCPQLSGSTFFSIIGAFINHYHWVTPISIHLIRKGINVSLLSFRILHTHQRAIFP